MFLWIASAPTVLALCSRNFAFAFDEAILYPYKMRSVYSEIIQLAWNVFLDPRML